MAALPSGFPVLENQAFKFCVPPVNHMHYTLAQRVCVITLQHKQHSKLDKASELSSRVVPHRVHYSNQVLKETTEAHTIDDMR